MYWKLFIFLNQASSSKECCHSAKATWSPLFPWGWLSKRKIPCVVGINTTVLDLKMKADVVCPCARTCRRKKGKEAFGFVSGTMFRGRSGPTVVCPKSLFRTLEAFLTHQMFEMYMSLSHTCCSLLKCPNNYLIDPYLAQWILHHRNVNIKWKKKHFAEQKAVNVQALLLVLPRIVDWEIAYRKDQ